MTQLQKLFLAIGAVVLLHANAVKAAETSSTIFRIQFAGFNQLSTDTNTSKVTKIWNLPETVSLRNTLLPKVAAACESSFFLNKGASIQPLLEDLLQDESIVELFESNDKHLHLNIAARLDEKRSAAWSSNLIAATSAKVQVGKDWVAPLPQNDTIAFSRGEKWTMVTLGSASDAKEFAGKVSKTSSLKRGTLVDGDIDWTRMETRLGIAIPFRVTKSKITITGKADDLFTNIRAELSGKTQWKAQEWHIPTVVSDPIISFSAAQPLAPFCKPVKLFEQIGFNPLTRQFYTWAQPDMPFQTFGAILTPNATNELKAFSGKLLSTLNPVLKARLSGVLGEDPSHKELLWTNVPLMGPYLRPFKDSSGEYIVGGLFPRIPRKTPVPHELFKQITGKSNVLYYDWEITENRIGHWDMLTRTLPIFSTEKITDSSKPLRMTRNSRSPAHVWLRAIARHLGNTVTEVTVTGTQELTVKRKSHLGFTGMELVYFAGLMDDPDFPFFGKPHASATKK